MTGALILRDATEDDVPIFFAQQLAADAQDNAATLRVLEKCGFVICSQDKGFSNARGEEVEEYLLMLRGR